MLRLGILIPPAASEADWKLAHLRNQASRIQMGGNQFRLLHLVRPRYLCNVALTVTNPFRLVNRPTTVGVVTKAA